jgi:hypothetical protein
MSYKTDYITEALIRLDFGVPIEGLKYSIEPELSKIILEEFKIYEPEELKGKEVKFDSNGAVDVINKEERNFRYFEVTPVFRTQNNVRFCYHRAGWLAKPLRVW